MKWRKAPEELVEKFSDVVPRGPRVVRRQMFGYPAAFVGGNLFMGLHQEAMILRLSDSDRTSFLRIAGSSVFEPMPGRPMREYVVVPPSMLDRRATLSDWIGRSLYYAASIKPKSRAGKKSPAKRGSPAPQSKFKRR